jgi:hypothetical protein
MLDPGKAQNLGSEKAKIRNATASMCFDEARAIDRPANGLVEA